MNQITDTFFADWHDVCGSETVRYKRSDINEFAPIGIHGASWHVLSLHFDWRNCSISSKSIIQMPIRC